MIEVAALKVNDYVCFNSLATLTDQSLRYLPIRVDFNGQNFLRLEVPKRTGGTKLILLTQGRFSTLSHVTLNNSAFKHLLKND